MHCTFNKLFSWFAFTVFLSFQIHIVQAQEQEVGGDFSLTDHNGEIFHLEQLRGKVVLLFFGYTHCPDVCPTELAAMAKVINQLKHDKGENVISLFVTVDPNRDTVDKLKNYVGFFSAKLIGLTGTKEEITKVTDAYKIQYKIHAPKENSDYYLVDHSANLLVINGNGKLVHLIPFGLPTEHILQVVQQEVALLKSN